MSKRIIHYSFKKAFNCVTLADSKAIKAEIMEILGDVTVARFYQVRRDYPNIPAHIKQEIEEIFLRYGVSKSEIWDIWE